MSKNPLRLSTYGIQLPTSIGTMLLYNSFSGGMDEVTGASCRAILKARQNGGEFAPETFTSPVCDVLLAQGHVTRWTRQEELKFHDARARELRTKLESMHQVNLMFLLTYSCNMKCPYCSQRTVKNKAAHCDHGFITPAFVDTFFAKTLPQLNESNRTVNQIVLIGGEPLQEANRPTIECILKNSSVHGAMVSATTNGYHADQFLDLFGKGPGKIERLLCTLDGAARFHDQTRVLRDGTGSYAKIVANLINIADLGVDIDININLTKKSSDSLNELVEELDSVGLLGRKNVSLKGNPISLSTVADSVTCIPEELSMCNMYQILAQRGLEERITSPRTSLRRKLREEIFDHPYARPSTVCNCAISNPTDLVIDPYSDIYACYQESGYPDKRVGKLRPDGSIDFFDRHRDTANMQVHLAERCRECPLALICGGGCWAYYEKAEDSYYQIYCPNMRKLFMDALLDIHSEMLAGSYKNERMVPYRYPHCDEIKGLWRACDPPSGQIA